MAKLSTYRTLVVGIASPVLAAAIGAGVYSALTRASTDRDADFVFRLTTTAIAMVLPFVITLFFAMGDRRQSVLSTSGKVGLVVAFFSLALAWLPVRGMLARARQAENLALTGVEAPPFDTVDIDGNSHRLSDHEGKVVLVNIWATWCTPCRREMPDLERLYQSRKDDGFMIFGLSTEDVPTQQKFADEVVVSYPLLTIDGDVPEIYSQTARYPANFLIDRNGRLQPAPSVDQPFENLEAAVDALLQGGGESD
jgi:peroxiredoxin